MPTYITCYCPKCGYIIGTRRSLKHKGLCQSCWATEVRKINKKAKKQ